MQPEIGIEYEFLALGLSKNVDANYYCYSHRDFAAQSFLSMYHVIFCLKQSKLKTQSEKKLYIFSVQNK